MFLFKNHAENQIERLVRDLFFSKEVLYYVKVRKFENRRNNICLSPLLHAGSFSRWCTILKMLEIPA